MCWSSRASSPARSPGLPPPACRRPGAALAGKAHALGVQLGISVAFTALLFLVLAWPPGVCPTAGEAMVVLAISTPILMGNRDLLATR